jgi:hypothetical protein
MENKIALNSHKQNFELQKSHENILIGSISFKKNVL